MSQQQIKIIGINGSPYKDGIVTTLLNRVIQGAEKAGAETEVIHLYDLNIRHTPGLYSADPEAEIVRNMPDDDMKLLYPKLEECDGIVFATPAYWANMSGAMKDFIDRLTPLENDGFKLHNKIAVFIAASKENEGGVEMAAMSMVAAIAQMGVHIPPNGIMWFPGSWKSADADVSSWAEEDAPHVGAEMVRLSHLLK